MAFVILVGLYTSRVVLNALGVEDFGIYNVAGSVVAMFGFLNGALAISSSRFLTVEMGKKNSNLCHLIRCYTTTKGIHALLSIAIVVISETIGLWLLYNKCEIPEGRMNAALWCYQISVATAVLSINQVPYNSLVIAHENMTIYAYLGIADVLMKLGICYLIVFSPFDNLIYYAILMLLIHCFFYVFYIEYCRKNYKECIWGYRLDKVFFRPILGFTGWNLLGSFSSMAMTQAANVMISFFFGPAIVAARAISGQVRGHLTNFVNNFRTAVNPQVLKRYAAGEIANSKNLLMFSTNVSFYLMLLITAPLLLETDFVLHFWLNNVPDYALGFTRITLLEVLFAVYDLSFYMIFQTTGRLRENAIICPIMDMVAFVIVYIVYKNGGDVLFIGWTLLALAVLQGMLVKPFLAIIYLDYKWKDFLPIYLRNIIVLTITISLSFCAKQFVDNGETLQRLLSMCIAIFISLLCSYSLGFNCEDKNKVKLLIVGLLKK